MRVLQVNATANWGSTGKIAEQIGDAILLSGGDSYIVYGRHANSSNSVTYKVGRYGEVVFHYFMGRFFDLEGRLSKNATNKLVSYIREIRPDIIHLHNIHDHWLNYELLFNAIIELDIHVVWTFHDCWAFTGHCTHFVSVNCDKWKTGCQQCPMTKPLSLDLSQYNYNLKKRLFTGVKSMDVVAVSNWISDLTKESFLGCFPLHTIYNGVDINVFCPSSDNIKNEIPIALFVSNGWSRAKGLYDIFSLKEKIGSEINIVIVGLQESLRKTVPQGIEVINRTNNVQELVELYNKADVFVNPTYADTFPTVNLEALACGTPVITYKTGGSPEAIDDMTGLVVEQGNIDGMVNAIRMILDRGKESYSKLCRQRALQLFDKNKCYQNYIALYESIMNQ